MLFRSNLGLLTIAFTLAGNVSNLLWGEIADRFGYRLVMLISLVIWVVSTLALFVTEGIELTSLIFVGIGAAAQGFQNAAANIVLEFGSREDIPMRLAISNSASEAVGAVATFGAGLLATGFGYEAVFIASICFLAIGGFFIRRHVPDPRHRTN